MSDPTPISADTSPEQRLTAYLASIPCLRILTRSERRQLADEARFVRLGRGERRGPEDGPLILLSGRATLVRTDDVSSPEKVSALLGPGDLCFEERLFGGPLPTTRTVLQSSGKVLAARLSPEALSELGRDEPALASALSSLASGGLRRFLEKLAMFSVPLDAATLRTLLEGLRPMSFLEGDRLVTAGDSAAGFSVLGSGRARRESASVPQSPKLLAAGDFFGETALCLASPEPVTVTAMTDGLLFRIEPREFERLSAGTASLRRLLSTLVGALATQAQAVHPTRAPDVEDGEKRDDRLGEDDVDEAFRRAAGSGIAAAGALRRSRGLRSLPPCRLPSRGVLAAVFLAAVFLQLLGLAGPLITQTVIDRVVMYSEVSIPAALFSAVIGAALFTAVIRAFRKSLLFDGVRAADRSVASGSHRRLFHLPMRLLAARTAGDVLTRSPEESAERALLDLPDVEGHVWIDRVTFRYERGLEPALSDLSLEVLPGEKVAIVGRSGAGKSTLAQLLLKLHEPESGAILLDGHDLRAVSSPSLRAQVGLVPQEIDLLPGTISENISFGRDLSPADILRAARLAGAHEFIARRPSGYETVVGERGSARFSAGEQQRLAIARALAGKPRLLILDEPTTTLDAELEAALLDGFEEAAGNGTLIVLAQRSAFTRRADRIIVLDKGHVAEQGTHVDLMERGGYYASLHMEQSL